MTPLTPGRMASLAVERSTPPALLVMVLLAPMSRRLTARAPLETTVPLLFSVKVLPAAPAETWMASSPAADSVAPARLVMFSTTADELARTARPLPV